MINYLHPGQTFTIALKGNPSTGYSWSYRIMGDSNSVIINSEYMSGSMIGSGGTYTFHGQAIRAGTFSIIFSYSRPWENVPPVKSLRFNFIVSQSV